MTAADGSVARGAALVAAALALGACGGGGERAPRFRNLVVVMVDTLRSDHLPSYGYERDTAPFLAELAREGIQLQGYSASSWTRPSVATLLTGLQPQRHQAIGRSDQLPEGVPYLPELLADEGFDTVAFVGNRVVGRFWGFVRGFTEWGQSWAKGKLDGALVTERAIERLDAIDGRFFLYVHYVDPHDPYTPERAWESGGGLARELGGPVSVRAFADGERQATEAERARLVDRYDGEIREVDAAIRTLVEALRERGLLERTLVVVTADHGEEFADHGGWIHGRTLFEEVVAVPFLVWSEEGLPRLRSDAPFHHVDFAATALDALGIRTSGAAGDGRSRWAELVSGEAPRSGALHFHLDLDGHGTLALRRGASKLVHDAREPHDRLFDLASDPREERPVADADELARMRGELVRHHNELAEGAAPRAVRRPDAEEREALEAMGYLDARASESELEDRVVPPRLDPAAGLASDGGGTPR